MFDISLGTDRNRLCNGVSRRSFLRVGALAPFGLSVAGMLALQNRARAAAGSNIARPPEWVPRAKSVILVYLGGGLSHHDTFDMKPDAAEEIRGKYKSIPTGVTLWRSTRPCSPTTLGIWCRVHEAPTWLPASGSSATS